MPEPLTNHLSTSNPHTNDPQLIGEPGFSYQHFNSALDRSTEWRVRNVPWRLVRVPKLYAREEFTPGSSYGRNAWGELYKGETVKKLYVRLPEDLVTQFNLLIVFNGWKMSILKDAQPDLVKPRRMTEPELMHYYRWMGRG